MNMGNKAGLPEPLATLGEPYGQFSHSNTYLKTWKCHRVHQPELGQHIHYAVTTLVTPRLSNSVGEVL